MSNWQFFLTSFLIHLFEDFHGCLVKNFLDKNKKKLKKQNKTKNQKTNEILCEPNRAKRLD